jgi:hypothetical protein
MLSIWLSRTKSRCQDQDQNIVNQIWTLRTRSKHMKSQSGCQEPDPDVKEQIQTSRIQVQTLKLQNWM